MCYLLMQLHEGVKKSGIMGFCDPCPGEPKQLYVEYAYAGNQHKVFQVYSILFKDFYILNLLFLVDTWANSKFETGLGWWLWRTNDTPGRPQDININIILRVKTIVTSCSFVWITTFSPVKLNRRGTFYNFWDIGTFTYFLFIIYFLIFPSCITPQKMYEIRSF